MKMLTSADKVKLPLGEIAVWCLAIIFIFEEIINFFIGSNIIGIIVVILFAVALTVFRYEHGETLVIRKTWLFFVAISIFIFPLSLVASGCSFSVKGTFSLVLLGCALLLISRVQVVKLITSSEISSFLLITIIIALVAVPFGYDLWSKITGHQSPLNSGLYGESSHLAIYLLPLLCYRILKNYRDPLSWITIIISLLISPSLTLIIGLCAIITLLAIAYLKNLKNFITIIIVIASMIGVLLVGGYKFARYNDKIISLVQAEEIAQVNLSSMVWLNGWSQAYEQLTQTYGLGVGFNNMGCGVFERAGTYSDLEIAWVGGVLNYQDGSFLWSKLVSELGVAGIIMVLIVTVTCIRAIFDLRKFDKHNATYQSIRINEVLIMRATGAACLLLFLYVRSLPYFMLPVILVIALISQKRCSQPNRSVRIGMKAIIGLGRI